MEQVLRYLEENRGRYFSELKQWIAIPSVSTNNESRDEVRRCAEWAAGHLQAIGMRHTQIFPTAGHPNTLQRVAWRTRQTHHTALRSLRRAAA